MRVRLSVGLCVCACVSASVCVRASKLRFWLGGRGRKTRKQTNEQTGTHTQKQTKQRTNERTNAHTQTNAQTSKRANKQASERANAHFATPTPSGRPHRMAPLYLTRPLWARTVHLAPAGDEMGSPQPHLRRDWAHPVHICAGTEHPAICLPGRQGPAPVASASLLPQAAVGAASDLLLLRQLAQAVLPLQPVGPDVATCRPAVATRCNRAYLVPSA
jgi:hypothetical protein